MNGVPKQSLGTRGVVLLGVALSLAVGTVHAAESDKPPILREVTLQQKLNAQVPLDLPFRDETGRDVTLADCMDGKTSILVLAYFKCPMLCTQVLNDLTDGLRGVPWKMGEEFNVLTISFDDRETPELAAAKKKAYVERYSRPGAEKGWHFLTGQQQPILRLANAVGFQFRYDPKHDQFAHPSCIMILTPTGKVARYFLGLHDVNDTEKTFARDLRLGLVEASEHKIGSRVVDSLLLYCYHYDPETGKYTMAALNLVRAAGAVTVVVLGSLLLMAWRRERRKNQTGAPPMGNTAPVAGSPG